MTSNINQKVKFFKLLTVICLPLFSFSQKELDQAVIDKIMNTEPYKKYYMDDECHRNRNIIRVNLIFDTLPVVTYDLSKATFVADEIQKKDYGIPNCTDAEQTYIENLEFSTTLKTSAVIERTDAETDKITQGFKAGVKVADIGVEFSMSEDYQTSMTIRRQSSIEATRTYKEAKTINLKLKPQTYNVVRMQAKKGVLRVPFKAHFVVSGTFVQAFDVTCGTIVSERCPGNHCEVTIPIKWFLKPEELTFNFEGYVASENSSDLQLLYDARKIDKSKDCIFSNSIVQTNKTNGIVKQKKINSSKWPISKIIKDGGNPNIKAEPIIISNIENQNYIFKPIKEL